LYKKPNNPKKLLLNNYQMDMILQLVKNDNKVILKDLAVQLQEIFNGKN
jgi:hypothetical protein